MRVTELLRVANGRDLYDLLIRQSSEEEIKKYKVLLESLKPMCNVKDCEHFYGCNSKGEKVKWLNGEVDESGINYYFLEMYKDKCTKSVNDGSNYNESERNVGNNGVSIAIDDRMGNNDDINNTCISQTNDGNNDHINNTFISQTNNNINDDINNTCISHTNNNVNDHMHNTYISQTNNNINSDSDNMVNFNYRATEIFKNEDGSFMPLSLFKEKIFDDMQILEKKGLVKRDNFYEDLLSMIADDIITIKFMQNERTSLIQSLQAAVNALNERKEVLIDKMKLHEETLVCISNCSLKSDKKEIVKSGKELKSKRILEGMIYKQSGDENMLNVNNKINNVNASVSHHTFDNDSKSFSQSNIKASTHTLFGGSLYSYNYLITQKFTQPSFVLNSHLNTKLKSLTFIFNLQNSGEFKVEIKEKGELLFDAFSFRFDELLKMRICGVEKLVVRDCCVFFVEGLVEFLNRKYIK